MGLLDRTVDTVALQLRLKTLPVLTMCAGNNELTKKQSGGVEENTRYLQTAVLLLTTFEVSFISSVHLTSPSKFDRHERSQ